MFFIDQLCNILNMIRISMPIDYGSFANSTSLNLIARKMYLELGKLMNNDKSFVISATLLNDSSIGNVNQHYDCVCIPNMGGYRFPLDSTLKSKNLIVGIVGIDEVVLGREVYKTENDWLQNKPIIEQEIIKWKKNIDMIKLVHVSNVSEKNQLVEYLKVPEEKIRIIPYGVDHNLFKPTLDKIDTRKNILEKFLIKETPYLLHISESNWARKNVLRLLEAFKKAKSFGIPHKLLIAGKNDKLIFKTAESISDVHMLGYVSDEDLTNLLQASDALINPSIHEGFGLPMLEAMACAIPVITCNVFSPPEIVGEGGLFVDPRNTDDICSKILEICKSENLRDTLAAAGLKRSMNFSWEKTALQLYELYKEVSPDDDFDFDAYYEKSAFRTLTSICLINPQLKRKFLSSILKFDFTKLIEWSLSSGLDDPTINDYLIPLENWMENYLNKIYTIKKM
jgi:glycosyltransferase involved in cell wall biosynthesis